VVLVMQYEKASSEQQQAIFDFYLDHTACINNWDLVDTSAPYIVGHFLLCRPRDMLYQLAISPVLWERRIAIVACLRLIKAGDLDDAFRLAENLLGDNHDLMHKATGWVLREAGKVSRPRLLLFLEQHYALLPRTTLRYAIEHLSPAQRKRALSGIF
jgi:3-methyladenine DNA glycosylase AlkD